ncbi:type II toxin-antitoxin system VapC family toxin [Nodularia spumigena]|uniref:type II toxin-antitoxin system VapC family toxin n=1 Tax=Nodularia spumigena TaxID=70799 RepID=UPI00232BA3B2|nr:type II toxin-antitoxin system VapC family toxin [Nodularia spumigena]MDB9356078.1 type II toxin-antitoxin system VapC family toxin [Nodularia spumigena CS-587/03]MDB9324285.1 type II toxin-antitoxin system VapC family toxin [Nodularia spumigena CS-591/07A]MDB9331966.1 type II toxin-antitoxin system VapC family toxin [Nodularia spumigena CS-591/04]MDB9337922.1 type II toxin-antitoxin system VapC family toxin [Nodularia spumigena CS-589/07]MDB9359566.1 type II toxin-antitoxin system VapC fam
MTYLLDTDTCIYWIKNINSVRNKIQQIGWEQICICNITVAELYFGAYNSQRVVENLTRAENFIRDVEVIALDNQAVKKFGELKAELRKTGQPVADFDLLIASVSLTRNYILVTNNTRHYSRISKLKLEHWISP